MKGEDSKADPRLAPSKQKFKDKLNALDPDLIKWLDDHEALRIVIESENLKMAATAKFDMLAEQLEHKCELLCEWGILPKDLGSTYKKVRDSRDPEERARALNDLADQIARVCDDLKGPLWKKLVEPFEKPSAL